jgi:hypothetical protein
MEKEDVRHKMKLAWRGQGIRVIPVPFMAQQKFRNLC